MTNYTSKETGKDGTVRYYNDKGELHRLDGPAIEGASGGKSWYVDGKNLTEERFNKHPLVVEAKMVRLIGEVLSDGK